MYHHDSCRLVVCTKEFGQGHGFRVRLGTRPQVRIQDLGKGRLQLLRPKVAGIAKWSCVSRVSHLWPGFRAHLMALEFFRVLMLKYAFCHILETPFLLFLTANSTPKTDKNSTLHCTSINLRYFHVSTPFVNFYFYIFMRMLCLWLFDLRRYAEWSEARKFMI